MYNEKVCIYLSWTKKVYLLFLLLSLSFILLNQASYRLEYKISRNNDDYREIFSIFTIRYRKERDLKLIWELQSALSILFMVAQSISLSWILLVEYYPLSLRIRSRTIYTRVLNTQWCNGNKRKISLKVDTPRIVCYAPSYSKRKAAAGQCSRGWKTSLLKFLSRALLKASFRRRGARGWEKLSYVRFNFWQRINSHVKSFLVSTEINRIISAIIRDFLAFTRFIIPHSEPIMWNEWYFFIPTVVFSNLHDIASCNYSCNCR